MIKWFKKHAKSIRKAIGTSRPDKLRRWESAQTNRLNSAHWGRVTGEKINKDLESDLENLRTRSAYEASNNSLVEGVIATHVTDVVGARGPILQVRTDGASKKYAERLESIFREWWKLPDLNGVMSGVDLLHLWVESFWKNGECLAQLTTDPTAPLRSVRLRVLNLDPRRLSTPYESMLDNRIVLGVERNDTGKPVKYHIEDDDGTGLSVSTNHAAVDAANIVHEFRVKEAGQARGVPWLASGLQTVADVRDYDEQVLDAARAAADWAVVLSTVHPDIEAVEQNEEIEVERRTMKTLPPGYTATQMQAEQPATTYVDYRAEKQRDLGRPVGMPLMTVRLDSSGHNYSSARFDGQNYQRSNRTIAAWLERRIMDRFLSLVEREARLAGMLPKRRPTDLKHTWTWEPTPHVDPYKEAKAEAQQIENKTLSRTLACAARGLDFDDVSAQLAREDEKLREAGLDETEEDTDNAETA